MARAALAVPAAAQEEEGGDDEGEGGWLRDPDQGEIAAPRGAAVHGADDEVAGAGRVALQGEAVWVDGHQGRVVEAVDDLVRGVAQGDELARVDEDAGIVEERVGELVGHAVAVAVVLLEGVGVAVPGVGQLKGRHHEAAGGEERAVGEGEGDPVPVPPGEVHRAGAGIEGLDELRVLAIREGA